jgi:hypothetical protein
MVASIPSRTGIRVFISTTSVNLLDQLCLEREALHRGN